MVGARIIEPLAVGDQHVAAANEELDELAQVVRAGDEEHGEAQSLADFMAWLSSGHNPPYLAALVVVDPPLTA